MTHEPFSNYYWHTQSPDLKSIVAEVEAYREELIKRGQADPYSEEYVRVVADRLGAILRRFYDPPQGSGT